MNLSINSVIGEGSGCKIFFKVGRQISNKQNIYAEFVWVEELVNQFMIYSKKFGIRNKKKIWDSNIPTAAPYGPD